MLRFIGKLSDTITAENGVTETESMESKVTQYEEEMVKFLENSEDTNVDALVYSSDFLRLMRTIVKELRHIKCPKSDMDLTEMGIDKAGMPVNISSKKVYTGSKDFVPSFVVPNNTSRMGGNQRPTYVGRNSDRLRQKKPMVSGRASMDRLARNPPLENTLPRKSANAWRPSREVRPADDAEAERLKYEKQKKEIRGLLNKITPSTYEILVEEFVSKKINEDSKLLEIIIDLIFDKAVEEPRFCPLYSDLCKRQVDIEQKMPVDQQPATSFRKSLILKCQRTFQASASSDNEIKELEKQLEEELEAAKKDEMKEKIEFLKSKEKRRLNGIIQFVAELYRHNLLINSIINWCAVELVQRYEVTFEDVYIEYAVNMIAKVGATYERKKASQPTPEGGEADEAISKVFVHLSNMKGRLSNRVRFMIMDLEDLRRNNWVSRSGDTGPKTMEEVRNEAEQEQLVNQAEREAYEKKLASRDMGGRKGGGKSYLGRGSTDNRMHSNIQSEKRISAVIASNQSGTSTLKKDMDLKKCEEQQKLICSRQAKWTFNKRENQSDSSAAGSTAASSSARTSTPPTAAGSSGAAGQSGELKESSPPAASKSTEAIKE